MKTPIEFLKFHLLTSLVSCCSGCWWSFP
jgi:hypothetical protein